MLLVFAPGDGAQPADGGLGGDPLLHALGHSLAAQGVRTLGFDSPAGEPGLRDARWKESMLQLCSMRSPQQSLVLGGFSRGARVAAGLIAEVGACALLGFAYPLHAVREDRNAERIGELANLEVPGLICQGERDPHGNRAQVRGYGLPARLQWHWMQGTKHRLWSEGVLLPQVLPALEQATRFVGSLAKP